MKKSLLSVCFLLPFIVLSLSSCCRTADDVWDDTRTAGRHMSRGLRSLSGKHGESRQICSREDFYSSGNNFCIEDFQEMEFEPLPDQNYHQDIKMNESRTRNREVPGIEAFQNPNQDPTTASIFQNIQFPYNSSLVKGRENTQKLHAIAEYMKKNPSTYLFVEGHCDERGAEAYNLALGSRRSNSVRNQLIKEGVGPERIFNVSYGREKPLDKGHTEEAWALNRRAQFKIYQE